MAVKDAMKAPVAGAAHDGAQEDTPLLQKQKTGKTAPTRKWPKSIMYKVLLAGFLVSLSFGVTQVPLIYVIGVMTCDDYFETHNDPGPGLLRCRNHAIEASTARSVAFLGASTTLFGVFNLFFTGWTIKAIGLKKALMITIFMPSVRAVVQNIGVETGAGLGVTIIQCSQMITVLGGPAGYLLALNSFAAEVVEPFERTATLGRLMGCSLFGTAGGFLLGGLISETFGIIWPFRTAIILFFLSTLYAALFLPFVPLNKELEEKASKSLSTFFDPLKMFYPRKWRLPDGSVHREYGILLVGVGTFLGITATGYIPVLLQMYATDAFGFRANENGWLISLNCLVRGLFLTFAFPVLISRGRKWLDSRNNKDKPVQRTQRINSSSLSEIPVTAQSLAGVRSSDNDDSEPASSPAVEDEKETFNFDLYYVRFSLIADGILTACATFTSEGWQMYVVAVAISLAAGAGSAAKGTILQMCSPAERADALGAISLVEMIARLTTTGLFGLIFSAFAAVGKPHLTFVVNGAFAVVAFTVMLFARFPPEGATRIADEVDGREQTAAE